MKIIFLIGTILLTTFLSSCTHDKTPAGIYKGHYDNADLPVTSGKGTVTITDTLLGKVNMLFVSEGNPNIEINNLHFSREMINNNFTIKSDDFSLENWVCGTGFCGTRKRGNLQITNCDPAFHFNGRKRRK